MSGGSNMMSYNPELYIHDMDRKALAALTSFPAFYKLCEIYDASIDKKAAKIEFMSTAIRLGEDQMPNIYRLLPPICEKLEIEVPELYYVKSKEINAATSGTTNPYIFLTSEFIEKIPEELIGTALAHECGHIACKHTLYWKMAMQMMDGVESGPLAKVPGIRKHVTPALLKSLMFWSRCSEMSADRAAVLCDGGYEKTIDLLLRVHGYGDDINREAFLKQALDLRDYVNEDRMNKAIEIMLTDNESHPRLAMRACECYEWYKSNQYIGISNGTYTLEDLRKDDENETEITNTLEAEIIINDEKVNINEAQVDASLKAVSDKLERYTNKAQKEDYAYAVACGILTGILDSVFVGDMTITKEDIGLSHKQMNLFIHKYAKSKGIEEKRLPDVIAELEKEFPVAQDNVWKGEGINITPKNHHLADLAHHPTPTGLVSAIVVRFLRIGTFVDHEGKWHFRFVKTKPEDIIQVVIPAILTGFLNWLVSIAETKYEEYTDEKIPEAIKKLIHFAASTPIILEIAKCADNWFGHLVSDMGGSSGSIRKGSEGMGVPGILVSLLHEISSLPILKDTALPQILNHLYVKKKSDLIYEMNRYKEL